VSDIKNLYSEYEKQGIIHPNGKLEVTNSSSTVPTGFFRNTSGAGDSPSLTVQGGANNSAPNFKVLDYDGNTDFVVQGTGAALVGRTTQISSERFGIEVSGSNQLAYLRSTATSGNPTLFRIASGVFSGAIGASGNFNSANISNGGILLDNFTLSFIAVINGGSTDVIDFKSDKLSNLSAAGLIFNSSGAPNRKFLSVPGEK
jgi:hypothetical protein